MTGHRHRIDSKRLLLVARLALGLAPALADCAAAQFGAVGLSAFGAHRLHHPTFSGHPPRTNDFFGNGLAVGDFNGNGAVDLAIGVWGDDLAAGPNEAGIVIVRSGVPGSGFPATGGSVTLSQVAFGSPDPAEVGDGFGVELAACDLNGDGRADLVVGVPGENVGPIQSAGAVQIHRGSFLGLDPAGDQLFDEDSAGIPGAAEAVSLFGSVLACGDFDADGADDLVIGSPNERVNGHSVAGRVVVVPGGSIPLDLVFAFALDQDTTGIADDPEPADRFGATLAVGDFDDDGFDDLAIGAPGESSPELLAVGIVQIVRGSAAGLSGSGSRSLGEAELGGVVQGDDRFGAALAVGDWNGDGRDDLVVGAPDDEGSGIAFAGQVIELRFSIGGLEPTGTRVWTEDAIHGPESSELLDRFGFALAAGDFDRDGFDDLAIGHLGESQLVPGDGAVTVIVGSATGLSASRRHELVPGHDGLLGPPDEPSRNFGQVLAAGDFDADGYDDLAVGVPSESQAGVERAGSAYVLYGSLFSDGFESRNAGFWSDTAP